jgi:hypothetical protein
VTLIYGPARILAEINGQWRLISTAPTHTILEGPASSAGSNTAPPGAAAREQERHDGEPGS